ncbi:MAG: Nramp family divalent metal transporter [Candidatus Blackburnbacteria bacterium]|nr:Nramp family divalent metal transporter [Candidatus Blackburnbacteria bacterium]
MKNKFNRFLRILGPGLITGAADDDPSGIATYSQAGAQFGYGQLWTAVFMLPFQTAVQEACARIGAVTGRGLIAVIRENYTKNIVSAAVILVLIANTINIGADLGAMAAATQLLIPVNFTLLVVAFTVLVLILEIFTSYKVYAQVLKWLALALLSYPVTVFMVNQPWNTLLRATFLPHFELNFAFLFIITGVLGTTISPYMFFWQASEEIEEEKEKHLKIGHMDSNVLRRFINNLRLDTAVGMLASEIGTWSIIVVAATVLNTHGVTDIKTSADAARALEPLVQTFPNSGFWAKFIFSVGILGLGLLSVPVLSGSASYAVSEAFSWREGLNLKLKRAHGFYGVIIIATLVGLLINFIGIDPVRALVYTAVINGVVAVPLLFLIGKIAQNEKIMGEYKSGALSKALVWFTFVGMGAAAIAMLYTMWQNGGL